MADSQGMECEDHVAKQTQLQEDILYYIKGIALMMGVAEKPTPEPTPPSED